MVLLVLVERGGLEVHGAAIGGLELEEPIVCLQPVLHTAPVRPPSQGLRGGVCGGRRPILGGGGGATEGDSARGEHLYRHPCGEGPGRMEGSVIECSEGIEAYEGSGPCSNNLGTMWPSTGQHLQCGPYGAISL